MANEVRFVISADGAKAIQEMLRFAEAQGKAVDGFKKTAQHGNEMGKTLGHIADSWNPIKLIAGVAGGALAFDSLRSAVVRTAEEYTQRVDAMTAKAATFETELRPTFSLGDNPEHTREIRQLILDRSAAYGKSTAEMANTEFFLQSNAANLSKTIQQQLMVSAQKFTELVGGDMQQNLTAGIKITEIYGDQVESVADVFEKIFKIGEEGALTYTDVAQLISDVAAPAHALGYSIDEVGAALIRATQVGGKTEKTFTGVRNYFLEAAHAADKLGISLHRNLAQDLAEFNRAHKQQKEMLPDVWGHRTLPTAVSLADAPDQVVGAKQRLGQTKPGGIEGRLAMIRSDPAALNADLLASAKQFKENLETRLGADSAFMKRQIEQELTDTWAKEGAEKSWYQPEWVRSKIGNFWLNLYGEKSRVIQDKLPELEATLRAGGNSGKADDLRLLFGQAFETVIGKEIIREGNYLRTRPALSDESAASLFELLKSQDPGLTFNSFRKSLQSDTEPLWTRSGLFETIDPGTRSELGDLLQRAHEGRINPDELKALTGPRGRFPSSTPEHSNILFGQDDEGAAIKVSNRDLADAADSWRRGDFGQRNDDNRAFDLIEQQMADTVRSLDNAARKLEAAGDRLNDGVSKNINAHLPGAP